MIIQNARFNMTVQREDESVNNDVTDSMRLEEEIMFYQNELKTGFTLAKAIYLVKID